MKQKQHKKRVILTSIAVGAAGVLGYFGWQLYKKKMQSKNTASSASDLDNLLKNAATPTSADLISNGPMPPASTPKIKPKASAATDFSWSTAAVSNDVPLKRGSKGAKVQLLQRALLTKYGKSILPRYGADGSFGIEMVAALKKAGLPTSIDESAYNVLIQGVQPSGSSLGIDLYKATIYRDFNKVVALLKTMSTTSDYAAANAVFRTYRIDGVRQTIVNAMLNTFTEDQQQQAIKYEFLRIGLQFNGSQWSLSGLGGLPIITTEPATIWINARRRGNVPPRGGLGNEITKRLDFTLFENQGRDFLVSSPRVRYV